MHVVEYHFKQLNKNSKGRPKSVVNKRNLKLTNSQEEQIVSASTANPFATAVDLHKELHEKIPFSVQTFRNVLDKNDLKCHIAACKPLLTNAHKANRLLFAEDCLNSGDSHFDNIIFSDESKFESCNTRKVFVRRPTGEKMNPKYIKFNLNRSVASVNVWGAFSKHYHTPLVRIDGKLNSKSIVKCLLSI